MSKSWKRLTGPPLTSDQTAQMKAIMDQVLAGTMPKTEGLFKIAQLAEAWGLPLDEHA